MDAVKNDVKRLVKIELAAANKKFRMFAGHMRARESSKKKSWKLRRR